MGVSGLLPLLKSIQKPTELKKYDGQTLGVDGYGWLHRAAYSCALELGQDKPTQKYITSAMHRVRMLRHFGVTPYMVFDGDFLPSKAATEDSREKKRNEKKKAAVALLRAGKTAQATHEFQKCIDITPEMASAVIQELKKLDIPYVVAPYEADAQLVYLEQQGLIHGIISDDSDLLVFGAKKLLTKLDQYGNCIEINRKDFCRCREVSLTGWSDAEFRRMAILSGCDYIGGLPGMGLKTAYRMLRKSKTPERVVRMVQFQGKRVSENYLTQFYQAELTFLHQWVFCPKKQQLVHLTELEADRTAEEMPFIGAYVEPEMARAIAKGDVNPITKTSITTHTTPSKRRHSQSTDATTKPLLKPITSYFKGPHRVPMGEMDPNCFEVDPQRVAQITGGGLVPRVFPLPRPYLDNANHPTSSRSSNRMSPIRVRTSPRIQRRRTEPISNMLARMSSSPVASRRTSSGVPASGSVAAPVSLDPTTRPPKKARLCNENEIEPQDGSPQKSRFFSAPKPRKVSRKAYSDAYLLSDDSLEDALRDLPDFEGWKPAEKPKRSISIYTEDNQETGTSADTESQQSTIKDEETPASSLDASMPPPQSKAPSSQPTVTPRSTLARFSYSSMSSATPTSTISQTPSSVFSVASTPPTAPSTAASRMTPLQRLGALAMNKPSSPKLPKPRQSLDKKFFSGVPVNPSFVPLPKVDLKEVEALNTSGGSEDQIIPDSEGEDDEFDISPKKLDLSRFAFA